MGDQTALWYNSTLPFPDQRQVRDRFDRLWNTHIEIDRKLNLTNRRFVVYPTTKIDNVAGSLVTRGAFMDFDDLTCAIGGEESRPCFGPGFSGSPSVSSVSNLLMLQI